MAYSNKQNPQLPPQWSPPPGRFDPRLNPSAHLLQPPVQHHVVHVTVNRRPTWLRFLRAFSIASIVATLCTLLFHTFLSKIHYHPWIGRPGSYPIPSYVTLERCVSYEDWSNPPGRQLFPTKPFQATTTLDLPLSAETLLLLSRGPMSSSSVEIVTSPQQKQNVATVKVIVGYFREVDRDEAKVCQIVRRRDRGIGVGIFTPERPRWHYGRDPKLEFSTTIILPELSAGSSPLLIKKLETDVPNTVQRVGDLNEKVLFKTFVLKGSNGRIDIESLQANVGVIGTSNAGIKGIFNTSSSLSLVTSNGAIDADVGLLNIDSSEPKVSLITNNAAITSKISLVSDTDIGGKFHAVATTSNGRLDVGFPAAPPYSILTFSGTTSNGRAAVSLNPAYEGSFFAQTSNSKLWVNQDKSVVDPSGRDRKRRVKIVQIGTIVTGDVYWDDATEQSDSKRAGTVSVISSNAQIELDL